MDTKKCQKMKEIKNYNKISQTVQFSVYILIGAPNFLPMWNFEILIIKNPKPNIFDL